MMSGIGYVRAMALALCCIAVPAMAGKNVLSLGPGRGYDITTSQGDSLELVLTGTSMTTVLDALVGDGFTFAAAESFTTADLVGADIVFLGLFDPQEQLTMNEAEALDAFVRAGGALIYMGDNEEFVKPNRSVAGLFGLRYRVHSSALSASDIPNPAHPIIQGPAGPVAVYDGSMNLPGRFGGIDYLGTYAHSVLAVDNRTVVAAIEPGRLQPGSGPVVYISEANGFLDAGLGTVELGDNLTLMRNIFAYGAGQTTTGCTTDADCADGTFCNGAEICDPSGVCVPGNGPCGGSCDHCVEDMATCEGCLLDLDGDGVIGTGDFSAFAGCFGACYPPEDPCQASNFDGSADGCVGSGDFAPFSGCFGGSCEDCANCSGPGASEGLAAAALSTEDATIALVARTIATKVDALDVLPVSDTLSSAGQTMFIEVWANRADSFTDGLAAVYLDLNFDPSRVTVINIVPSELFSTFASGELDPVAGVIAGLGGATQPGTPLVGVTPAWGLVATVEIKVDTADGIKITTAPANETFGVSVYGNFGNLDPVRIAFRGLGLLMPQTFEEQPRQQRGSTGRDKAGTRP